MPFLKFLTGAPIYYTKLSLLSPILAGYFIKIVARDVAKQAVLREYLKGYDIDHLFSRGKQFSHVNVRGLLRPEGMDRLKWHQDQGHSCVLVSASLDIYLQEWAHVNGFEGVLCSSLEKNANSRVSGNLDGLNCYGEEKVRRVSLWLEEKPCYETYAYGDSVGDIPLLNQVDYGYLWRGGTRGFKQV